GLAKITSSEPATVRTASATSSSPQLSSLGPSSTRSMTVGSTPGARPSASRVAAVSVREAGLGWPTTTVTVRVGGPCGRGSVLGGGPGWLVPAMQHRTGGHRTGFESGRSDGVPGAGLFALPATSTIPAMSFTVATPTGDRVEDYRLLRAQAEALVAGEP